MIYASMPAGPTGMGILVIQNPSQVADDAPDTSNFYKNLWTRRNVIVMDESVCHSLQAPMIMRIVCLLQLLFNYPILAAPAVPVVITLISDLANGNEVENDIMTRRDKYQRPVLYVKNV